MKITIRFCCTILAVLLSLGCLVGCSSTPAASSGEPQTSPTDSSLTPEEQEVYAMLELVDELAVGMKDTADLAIVKATALLDRCEQTALSADAVATAAKTYYENSFGAEFGMMFDEKLRLVVEACDKLRDEATRAQIMQEAGAASQVEWTDKAFDTVTAINTAIKG